MLKRTCFVTIFLAKEEDTHVGENTMPSGTDQDGGKSINALLAASFKRTDELFRCNNRHAYLSAPFKSSTGLHKAQYRVTSRP